jgi:hypothetical protein
MPTTRPARKRLRLALLASALIAGAGGLGTPWTGLTVSLGDAGSLRIGAALAAGAVTLNDVTLDFGGASYAIPTLTVTGLNLSQGELTALFSSNAAEPLSARLARLSAQEATIPTLTVTQRVGPETRTTTYRDVTLRDIVNGRVAAVTSAGASVAIAGRPEGPVSGTLGKMTLAAFDAPQAARLYEVKADAPASMARIYEAFALEDLAISDPKGAQVRVARISGRDFSARPTKESWGETMTLLAAQGDRLDKAPPVDRARLVSALADLLDAFQIGSLEATGLAVSDPNAKDGVGARIARVAFAGGQADKPADLRLEDFDVTADNGRMRIGLIGFTGFSFRSTLDGLKALSDKPLAAIDPADLRALAPTIGTMRLSGLDFDVPNKSKPEEPKPQNIRFTVKDVEVTADKPVNGIPTDLRVGVRNLALAVPPDSTENGLRELAAMGYKALDLSFLTAANWNEPANELVVREVSVSGADMGRTTLKGVLGNVGRDAFNADSAVALVALVGATARNLDLTVENKGLFERALAEAARKQKRSPDDLRREYGMAAAVAIPAVLGSSPAAKSLGQAIARFVAKPGRLAISARTKDPAGLGIADVAAAGEPAAILDKLEVTATAE